MNTILLLSILVACAMEARAYDGLFFIGSTVIAGKITPLLFEIIYSLIILSSLKKSTFEENNWVASL